MDKQPSIMHVARYILESFIDMGANLTPLKLQKLLYYSQAWSLVWEERPMFEEDFQAWANGPVNPALYKKHKGLYLLEKDFLSEFSGFNFNDDDRNTLDAVLEYYGGKEPFYLSELTHKEFPWRNARLGIPPGEPTDRVIEKTIIQEYYTGISSAANAEAKK